MKKQIKKKLSIQRETLTTLRDVTGGLAAQSKLNDTVYHPPASADCATARCGNA